MLQLDEKLQDLEFLRNKTTSKAVLCVNISDGKQHHRLERHGEVFEVGGDL